MGDGRFDANVVSVDLSPDQARARFAASLVAVLGTVTPAGRPHLVPVTFAVLGDTVFTAVDAKPKRSTRLQRLRNINAQPQVSLLAQHYAADWTRLWWARADGVARIGEIARAPDGLLDALAARYHRYADQPPGGPLIAIEVTAWTGWAFES